MGTERHYVVQYRRKNAKKWTDSHCESFPTKPSKELILDEFANSAADLVTYTWEDDEPRLRGDFEVRVVCRETVEKEIPIKGIHKFSNEQVKKLVKGLL